MERDLLGRRALYIERIPEVLDHVREDSGVEAARAAGSTVPEYTLHPVVLERLEALAQAAEDEQEAARLTALRTDAEQAEKALEEDQE